MASFRDPDGRDWTVDVNYVTLQRVDDVLGVKLLDEVQSNFAMLENPAVACHALFLVCEDEAKERGVRDVDFAKMMKGDTYPRAIEALLRAIIAFFPSGRQRVLLPTLEASLNYERETEKMYHAVDGKELNRILNSTKNLSSEKCGESPESPE